MNAGLFLAPALAFLLASAHAAEIHDAARNGDAEKLTALAKADPALVNLADSGMLPLHLAALEGHSEAVSALLGAKASVSARGPRGQTALHLAMYGGHAAVAEVLLNAGAELEAADDSGQRPLHLAAAKGHADLVRLLLQRGADAAAADRDGNSAVHIAVAAAHMAVVKAILAANPSAALIRNTAGKTAITLATEKGETEMADYLQERAAEGQRVGRWRDPARIVFEGNKTFAENTLRAALLKAPDYQQFSHPLAPAPKYIESLRRNLQAGYRNGGFPEATVTVTQEVAATRILLRVEEGPRYRCGDILVTGAAKVTGQEIIERLTRTNRPGAERFRTFEFRERIDVSKAPAEVIEAGTALWMRGEPASFSLFSLANHQEEITNAFQAKGFFSPDFTVELQANTNNQTAELAVRIHRDGPAAVIGEVTVSGNRRNSREKVLKFLGLQPGQLLAKAVLDQAEERIWDSARLLAGKIVKGAPAEDGRIPLDITISELREAPLLDQEFTPEEQVFLRAHEWLSHLGEAGRDIVFTAGYTNDPANLEIIVSPRAGLILSLRDKPPEQGRCIYGALTRSNSLMLVSPANSNCLSAEAVAAQLTSFIKIEPLPESKGSNQFSLSLGAGFSGTGSPRERAAYRFDLWLPRVAVIGFVRNLDQPARFEGNLLVLNHTNMSLKIDRRTGEILEFRVADPKEKVVASLRFVPNAYNQAAQQLLAEAAPLTNRLDLAFPAASSLTFLLREMLSSRYLEKQLETWREVNRVLSSLGVVQCLAPIDGLWQDPFPPKDDEEFSVPLTPGTEDLTPKGIMAMMGDWFVRHAEQMFPEGSWPWVLVRETAFMYTDRAVYSEPAIEALYNSTELGPVGCWITAQMLKSSQPPVAHRFAALGLRRLSFPDFRRDCETLLDTNSLPGKCAASFAKQLALLEDNQFAALGGEGNTPRAVFLKAALQALRNKPDRSLADLLAPALEDFWNKEFNMTMSAALSDLTTDAQTQFAEGLKYYEGKDIGRNFQEAARLFESAAARGWAPADYFLGRMHEMGQGVEREMDEAIPHYRKAATAGVTEAAMALAQLYADGLDVQRDPVEAWAWYALAEKNGHKVAGSLKRGIQGKLTTEQIAKANQRLEELSAGQR